MAKKKTKNPYEHVFGSPEYLTCKFDDIDTVVESRKSKTAKEFKKLVESLKTDKDHMYCYEVLKTSSRCDGKPVSGYVAYIVMGLNGPGRGSDYAAALKRLLDTGKVSVFDAFIDAADDLWSFLVHIEK